jgi:hypothetical protein
MALGENMTDRASSGRQAQAGAGQPMDVAKYAGWVIDGYGGNKKHMDAEAARRVTLSAASSVQAEESGLKGRGAHRLESSAYQVGKSVLGNYADRVEEGYPAGEARAMAVRAAAGYYNERGEPKQAYGTVNVKEFSAGTIDEYRGRAAIDGAASARQSSTRIAAENAAVGNGVNYVRASKLADASVSGDQPRLGLTVQFARIEPARRTGAQRRRQPLFDKALANPLDGRHAHPHRLGNLGVDLTRPSLTLIGVKQDASMGQPPCRTLAARDQPLQFPAFVRLQRDLVAFGRHRHLRQLRSLPRQQPRPRLIPR